MNSGISIKMHHRGAYENLWHDHKYSILAVSHKKFASGAKKAGSNPQRILGFLDFLANCSETSYSEVYEALLSVYNEVKSYINHNQRRSVIEKIVANDSTVCEDLFSIISDKKIEGLYGCRLFFRKSPVFKYWDFGSFPGLWLMLGPFLVHVTPENVLQRITDECRIKADELAQILDELKNGLSKSKFAEYPTELQTSLRKNLLLSETGERYHLNLRFSNYLSSEATTERNDSSETTFSRNTENILLLIEKCWDSNPSDIPLFPEDNFWKDNDSEEFSAEQLNEIRTYFQEQTLSEGNIQSSAESEITISDEIEEEMME
ncbi:MAG: hypothetical protein HQM10_14790 [Candidatus Riflebacteria bacterium]|nr:hypothetical protein [Candidatus Riflebacteria bacterium]